MLDSLLFYGALVIFLAGLGYRMSTWFRFNIRLEATAIGPTARFLAAVRGITATLFSRKGITLTRVLVMDVLLQARLFKRSPLRWAMHFLIYFSFLYLLLMHGLDDWVSARLFDSYASTLNPYLFLRDLAGVLVLAGLAAVIVRRIMRKKERVRTHPADTVLIALIAVIVISGVALKASKISSYDRYQEMVDEYGAVLDDAELGALQAYWVAEFGLAPSKQDRVPVTDALIEDGKSAHEMSCVECHSPPQWAFTGYWLARLMAPLSSTKLPNLLWYFHYLAGLVALAMLPFTKAFHLITAPLSLMVNAVMDPRRASPANLATKQILELDACVHCGACTQVCSVAVATHLVPIKEILPSEKIPAIRALAAGKPLSVQDMTMLQQGIHLCTNCNRCTEACPVGINLIDLWFTVREWVLKRSLPEFLLLSPLSLYRGLLSRGRLDRSSYEAPLIQAKEAVSNGCSLDTVAAPTDHLLRPATNGSGNGYRQIIRTPEDAGCYGCMTCTNSCPVVQNYDNPGEALGLLPHQIMHAVGLKLWDITFESRMLWDCLGCYKCQEYCPQKVSVTEVLYQLKNVAIAGAAQCNPKPSGENQ